MEAELINCKQVIHDFLPVLPKWYVYHTLKPLSVKFFKAMYARWCCLAPLSAYAFRAAEPGAGLG